MTYRVAMVGACPYPVPQGSQVLLRDTALAVRARGHDVHLLVYGYGIGEDHSGLPIHRCAAVRGARKTAAGPSWAKPLLDLAMVRALRRLAREQHIQLVHAHNYEGLVVALGARKRPVIYHAHNAMADELPYYFDSRGARAMARITRGSNVFVAKLFIEGRLCQFRARLRNRPCRPARSPAPE